MSAYVVERAHIEFMVLAAIHPSLGGFGSDFRWWWGFDGEGNNARQGSLSRYDPERAAQVAQMLWDECVTSVRYRYPDCGDGELPGPIGCDYQFGAWTCGLGPSRLEPVAVLKAADGYEYQSCEHPGWHTSEARAFCDALRRRAIYALPGYDAAAWEVRETPKSEGIWLSDLIG